MTAFICESLQGQLSVVISARERRPQGGSGLGALQVSAILGCSCLRHQDLTLRGAKRKENTFSMEILIKKSLRSRMKQGRASIRREPRAAEQAAVPFCTLLTD